MTETGVDQFMPRLFTECNGKCHNRGDEQRSYLGSFFHRSLFSHESISVLSVEQKGPSQISSLLRNSFQLNKIRGARFSKIRLPRALVRDSFVVNIVFEKVVLNAEQRQPAKIVITVFK